jgi:energy-coupling factor transporter ATP-binding protein EcfA2
MVASNCGGHWGERRVQLTEFRVRNYRSINDSGPIKVAKLTTLVGRNESGKTNLLLALHSLNPAGEKFVALSRIKDFPRNRRLSECNDGTEVVHTQWRLSAEEQKHLAAVFPRAASVKDIIIGRRYGAVRWVDFVELKALTINWADTRAKAEQVRAALEDAAATQDAAVGENLKAAATKFVEQLLEQPSVTPEWATRAKATVGDLRKAIGSVALPVNEQGLLTELEATADSIPRDNEQHAAAQQAILNLLPKFIYLDEYPELNGHQNVADYVRRKGTPFDQLGDPDRRQLPADRNFEKLCKVADLNPSELQDLLAKEEHETRNQLTNRAGAVITTEIRRVWKDRPLKIRFHPDANHLDTLISDPNAVYDVEINLDERSRGFRWFFSFYVTFAADTKGGSAENAIILLDEPGLYLHATSQGDLIRSLSSDFKNQVIYTTHSPFMVPTENLDAIRTVNIDQDAGTQVSNDPAGDARTLFPLQAALGFNLAQSLFVGPNNLVVEGVTDYWILSSASEYLRGVGKTALPKELTMTPAGGAQKIPYMVALLTSERLNVLVLLDDEKQARGTKDELIKTKLIRDDNIVLIVDAFDAPTKPAEADIEDLLDEATFDRLVRQSYDAELVGKKLILNPQVPRIAKRYQEAFQALGLEFNKTRPARLLLNLMVTESDKIVTATAQPRFERLFAAIDAKFQKHLKRASKPFR